MAILSNGKFYGFLCSVKETGQKLANGVKEYVEDFVSGFAGHGWKIWEYITGKWKLEIDTIVVRETMLVFEMLISKIRAIIGAQTISQGHGKIKSVSISDDGTEYLIVLEDEDVSIVAHDFIRCQTFTGASEKLYHVEVASVDVESKTLHIPLSEFEQDESGNILNPPTPGDELVQFGNSQNKARQSAIYMHADETGQPAIDVMFDIDSKNWDGKVKVRVGGDIPDSGGLKGFYCVNGMIKAVDNKGAVIYEFAPSGAVNIGKGNIVYNPSTNKVTFGSGVTLTWDNLNDETKENLKGEQGNSLHVQYSVDGISNWHDIYAAGDIYMRQKLGDGLWSGAIQIVGDTGNDGKYTSFQFSTNQSLTESPTSGWQNIPPSIGINQYLWMRSGTVVPPATEPQIWTSVRISGNNGKNGDALYVQYSVDGINEWHEVFQNGDVYMRQKIGEFNEWSDIIRIVGEDGEKGAYMDYQFTVGTSSITPPTSGWQDAPPSVSSGQYLWMRCGWVTPPAIVPSSWNAVRIQGLDGRDGEDANLLPWIKEWNDYATELGKDYIVTPKMFSGVRSSDGKLTGIAQGKDCLTDKDGSKRTGIFALVDDEIVFELDPINKTYKFMGEISNTEDKWLLRDDGSGYLANKNIKWDADGYLTVKANISYPNYFFGCDDITYPIKIVDLSKSYNITLYSVNVYNYMAVCMMPNPNDHPDIEVSIYAPNITTRSSPEYFIRNYNGKDFMYNHLKLSSTFRFNEIDCTGVIAKFKSVNLAGPGEPDYYWFLINFNEVGSDYCTKDKYTNQ